MQMITDENRMEAYRSGGNVYVARPGDENFDWCVDGESHEQDYADWLVDYINRHGKLPEGHRLEGI